MPEEFKGVTQLSYERLRDVIGKAYAEAERAALPATLDRPRPAALMKIKEHLSVAAEWLVALESLERGY